MNYKYKCLILDHDDTTVNSTATIHYPSHCISMAKLRPEVPPITLEEYFTINCVPGILGYYRDVVKLNDEEMAIEFADWQEYCAHHHPTIYPEMKQLILDFKNSGGYICVISHNFSEHIKKDYIDHGLPIPDLIYGSEGAEEMTKPYPNAVYDLMAKLNLKKEEIVMIDDLQPGYDMAQAAGIDHLWACWAHQTKYVQDFIKEHNLKAFYDIDSLHEYLKNED